MRRFKDNVEEKSKKKKKGSFMQAIAILNIFMPYILSVLFSVVLFSLFGLLGKVGDFIRFPLLGSFSIAGAALFVILLLYHAIVWKYDLKHKTCIRRVICSFIAIVSISMLQHLIQFEEFSNFNPLDVTKLVAFGLDGTGGGLLGGILSYFLHEAATRLGAIAIVLVILLFMLLQMFNITPVSMAVGLFRLIFRKPKEKKEKKPKEKPVKVKKGKKVAVFDDTADTADERLEAASKANKPAYLDLSKYIDADEQEVARSERHNGYSNMDDQLINSRGTSSDQLRPYDDRYSNVQAPRRELKITSSQVEDFTEEQTQLRPASEYKPEPKDDYEEITSFRSYSERRAEEEETEHIPQRKSGPTPTFEFNADIHSERAYKNQEEVEEDDGFELEKHIVSISSFDRTSSGTSSYKEEEYDEPSYDEDSYNEPEAYSEPEEAYSEPESYSEPEDTYDELQGESYREPVEEPKNDLAYLDELIEKSANKPKGSRNLDENGVALDDASSYIPLDEKRKEAPKPAPPKKKAIKRNYKFPPIQFLQEPLDNADSEEARAELQENARIIVDTLNNFRIGTKISDITRGPTVTRYELVPEAGVRVRSIAGLVDDIALNLAAEGIRIECPIPGKSAVGIEVPNKVTSMVYLRELIDSKQFKGAKGKLTCALGKSISGENIYVDIEKTPHLLVAGATGMGKSVCINSLLVSLLYRTTPDDVRLILIDPKKVELSNYNGVPHLLVPVVCEPKKSLGALQWAVTEMETRFETIEAAGVRNLIEFNEKVDNGYDADKMARIVIVIDELADLKMTVPDIEGHITRLTQKARAAGIHIIIGTQRPSVDVITGLIKSNIPSRISFRVPSQVDSRTILDEVGAEKLVSRGDMLVKIVGALRPARVQGSFVSASEIEEVINFWKENSPAIYDEDVMHQIDSNAAKLAKNDKDFDEGVSGSADDDGDLDSAFYDALELATEMGKISSSFLQRKLRLGFQRAARIIDQMEDCGYIGEANGSKPRDVLITKEDYQEIMMRRNDD